MPTHNLNTMPGFVDRRQANGGAPSGVAYAPNTPISSTQPLLAVLNGTQTVANQFQVLAAGSTLETGQVIDVVAPAGTVRGSTRTITTITGTTTLTVTYSGADITTDANGDYVLATAGAELVGAPANYVSRQAIEARLAAINGTYFTATRLSGMNMSDLWYALRLADSPGSL